MKRYLTLLTAVVLLAGCTEVQKKETDTIYVSILPLRSIVRDIVGDDCEIKVLVPPGASPETFEPSPKQLADLAEAKMIVSVGLIDFENEILRKIDRPDRIVPLSRGIELLDGTCAHAHGNGDPNGHSHGIDPHVWTSPKALKVMARNAFEAIHEQWPDSAKYEVNLGRLLDRLEDLDRRTAEKINNSKIDYFIIYHPALSYYARDFGIGQVAIENEGKEPSAKQLTELIRNARKDKITKILYQKQFPASVVEVIARDIEARCVEIDPLKEEVIENIDEMTDKIVCP